MQAPIPPRPLWKSSLRPSLSKGGGGICSSAGVMVEPYVNSIAVDLKLSLQGIQGEVELQDVDPRLAQESELAAFHLLLDEIANGVFAKAARLRHAPDLIECGSRSDIGIETAS